jgi:hypothetical protein
LRLTANTPDAPILWRLNEYAITRVVGVPCDRKAVEIQCGREAVDLQNTGEVDPEDV